MTFTRDECSKLYAIDRSEIRDKFTRVRELPDSVCSASMPEVRTLLDDGAAERRDHAEDFVDSPPVARNGQIAFPSGSPDNGEAKATRAGVRKSKKPASLSAQMGHWNSAGASIAPLVGWSGSPKEAEVDRQKSRPPPKKEVWDAVDNGDVGAHIAFVTWRWGKDLLCFAAVPTHSR
jgi:hypothetical protein